jgi:hypothetical protein
MNKTTNPMRIHCSGVGFFQFIVDLPSSVEDWVRFDQATPLKIASTVIPHSASNHSGM